ncbi:MAG: hypothetical protein HY818_05275 [Acetobacterium woodii]|nr:hypothetical protein [Acetobacterium woodii]
MAKAEFTGNLSDLIDKLDTLSNYGDIDAFEAFSDDFMIENTSFKSFQEFIDTSGFEMENNEQLELISKTELDGFVRANTKFETYKEMSETAGKIVLKKRIDDLGL